MDFKPAADAYERVEAASDHADRILAEAANRSSEMIEASGRLDAELFRARRDRIEQASREIRASHGSIGARTARLVELMAVASERLVQHAREADFSPPPWPGESSEIVEIKLSQTQEVTFRIARRHPRASARQRLGNESRKQF